MDRLTREQRRKTMQAVKSKGTKLEMVFAKALDEKGICYQMNVSDLMGKPDFVLFDYKIVIFCDSEFWHGRNWNERKKTIKSNRDYWIPKIEKNIERDKLVTETLTKEGWLVLRFWGKDIHENIESCMERVIKAINDRKKT